MNAISNGRHLKLLEAVSGEVVILSCSHSSETVSKLQDS